ncbi:MAG TPA: M56 family metallopeptidase, partial [Terriglobales bacterium]|nr:M56 family metallopeptidase [Terriglobales bacterium]
MFFDFSLINMQTLPQALAGRVLNTVGEGFVVAGLSWLVLRIGKTRSATARFAVWFSTLLAVVLMPLLARQASAGTTGGSHFELASSWATYLFAAWAVIAGMFLVRLAGSLWHVRQLRRACREMDAESGAALFETLEQHPCGRRVKLLISDDIRIPTALGFFQPSIVLPSWTLAQLSAQELKLILLHELAHLRRHDDWTNLIQKLLKAVFFFHPAVWWIEEKLNLEREMACDDLVLDQTGSAKSYAASIISVAEKALSEKKRVQRTLALAQSAIGRVRQTSRRIVEILDPSKTKQTSSWRPAMALASGLLVLVLVATPYAPEMISFKAAGAEFSANSSAPA